jgi:hypothetical protein
MVWWPLIYTCNIQGLHHKVRRNFVSFCHCVNTLFLSYSNVNPYFILMTSASYFIWDIWYIWTQSRPVEWFNLLHHGLAVISLPIPRLVSLKHHLLTMMELSNVPTYIVYDLIKSNKDSKTMRIVQFLWFGYFRTVKIPQFVYQNWYNYDANIIERITIISMVVMGYIWTFVMAKKLNSMV